MMRLKMSSSKGNHILHQQIANKASYFYHLQVYFTSLTIQAEMRYKSIEQFMIVSSNVIGRILCSDLEHLLASALKSFQ